MPAATPSTQHVHRMYLDGCLLLLHCAAHSVHTRCPPADLAGHCRTRALLRRPRVERSAVGAHTRDMAKSQPARVESGVEWFGKQGRYNARGRVSRHHLPLCVWPQIGPSAERACVLQLGRWRAHMTARMYRVNFRWLF